MVTNIFPSIRQLNGPYDNRNDHPNKEAHAVIVPGGIPSPQVVNVKDFHCSHAHSHEALLRNSTASSKDARLITCKKAAKAP